MQKAIIIGATSGIGQEVARILVQQGWHIGIAGRREEALHALQATAPDRIVTEQLDVTEETATLHLHNLIKKLGGIDLFFLSSGVGHQNRDLQPDIELNTARTNVEGFTRMVTAAFNYFKEKAPDILLSSVPLQALKDWALHRPTLPPNASRIPISKRWHNLPGCSILIYTSPTSVRDLLPPIY